MYDCTPIRLYTLTLEKKMQWRKCRIICVEDGLFLVFSPRMAASACRTNLFGPTSYLPGFPGRIVRGSGCSFVSYPLKSTWRSLMRFFRPRPAFEAREPKLLRLRSVSGWSFSFFFYFFFYHNRLALVDAIFSAALHDMCLGDKSTQYPP